MRLTAENKYSPSLWNSHGEENKVEGTFVVPFEAFAKQNLERIKVFLRRVLPTEPTVYRRYKSLTWYFPSEAGEHSGPGAIEGASHVTLSFG